MPTTRLSDNTENRLRDQPATTDATTDVPSNPFRVNRLGLPLKVFELRHKLYEKAKREPKFRFYALYDRIYRRDVLEAAWDLVAGNDGVAGVDGVTIAEVVNSPRGSAGLVDDLQEELRTKHYRPQAVKRVYIPKPNGDLRPLGIPTVRDRVAQTAAKLILEPVFEADFLECSHGGRPGHRQEGALCQIKAGLEAGWTTVYDGDLKGYFDTIPHDKLMLCVEKRIADRSVLALIRGWLGCEVEDRGEDGKGPPRRFRSEQGTPQGGVISPLLANLYLHWFDKMFHAQDGPARRMGARLVRYCDDFIVMSRRHVPQLTGWIEQTLENRFDLTINRTKTRIAQIHKGSTESLDFLGLTFRYEPSRFGGGKKFLNIVPSKKAVRREREKIRQIINGRRNLVPISDLVQETNQQTAGWANYFRMGRAGPAFGRINWFVQCRLRTHLMRRSQRPCRPPAGVSWYDFMTNTLGLKPITWRTTS